MYVVAKINRLYSYFVISSHLRSFKVHIFWEGHKILRNLQLTFSYVVPVKSKVEISQNFVAFLEYMNFKYRTRAIISRSRFEAALVYKPRILSLKNEEFPVLVHKLSAI